LKPIGTRDYIEHLFAMQAADFGFAIVWPRTANSRFATSPMVNSLFGSEPITNAAIEISAIIATDSDAAER
jgi:hypothetical protein